MSSPATPAAPSSVQALLSGISASAQAGLASAVTQALNDATGIGLGLAGQEAQDFDDLTDDLVEDLEAGKTWSQAWADVSAKFVATEKTQLWADALKGIQDISAIIDGFNKTIQAIL